MPTQIPSQIPTPAPTEPVTHIIIHGTSAPTPAPTPAATVTEIHVYMPNSTSNATTTSRTPLRAHGLSTTAAENLGGTYTRATFGGSHAARNRRAHRLLSDNEAHLYPRRADAGVGGWPIGWPKGWPRGVSLKRVMDNVWPRQ